MARVPLAQILGITAGLATVGAGALGYVFFRRALPRTRGSESIDGLRKRVEIVRDRWGVPHIYAETTPDLYFALGYVHAQDRLWQMELNRRAAHGRLSEMFGRVTLGIDRLVRRVGLGAAAVPELAHMDEDDRIILEAYTSGVNALIERQRSRLPAEYLILRLSPEPWT